MLQARTPQLSKLRPLNILGVQSACGAGVGSKGATRRRMQSSAGRAWSGGVCGRSGGAERGHAYARHGPAGRGSALGTAKSRGAIWCGLRGTMGAGPLGTLLCRLGTPG